MGLLDELIKEDIFVCCGGYWDACHFCYAFDKLRSKAPEMNKDIEMVFPLDGIYYGGNVIMSAYRLNELLTMFEVIILTESLIKLILLFDQSTRYL